MTAFKSISELMGARVRELRLRAKLQQETIAVEARRLGFDWVRGTIAMIELGRRRLTVEEFLCLPQILENVGAGDLWLEDLFPAGEMAQLSPLIGTETDVLRAMLRGESRLGRESSPTGVVARTAPEIPGTDEIRRLARWWWPKSTLHPVALYELALASRGDAEMKAARALGVPPAAIALAADNRWGHSLTKEREARAERKGNGHSARSLQAIRGVVTRDLLEELRPLVKELTARTKRSRRITVPATARPRAKKPRRKG